MTLSLIKIPLFEQEFSLPRRRLGLDSQYRHDAQVRYRLRWKAQECSQASSQGDKKISSVVQDKRLRKCMTSFFIGASRQSSPRWRRWVPLKIAVLAAGDNADSSEIILIGPPLL